MNLYFAFIQTDFIISSGIKKIQKLFVLPFFLKLKKWFIFLDDISIIKLKTNSQKAFDTSKDKTNVITFFNIFPTIFSLGKMLLTSDLFLHAPRNFLRAYWILLPLHAICTSIYYKLHIYFNFFYSSIFTNVFRITLGM